MPLFSRNSSTAQQTAGSFNTDAVNAGADSLNQGPYVAPLRLSASTAQRMQHLHKPKDLPAVEVEWVLEVQQEPKLFTRGMLAQRHQQLGTEAISRVLNMVLTPEGCANAVGEGPDASVVMAIVVQTAPTGSYQQPPQMQHIWVLAHGDNLNGQLEPLFQDISTHLVGSSGGGAGRKGGTEGFRTYVGVKINVRKAVEERRARAQAEQGAGQIGEAEQDQVEVETVASSCAADLAALLAEENGHHAGHHVHRVDLSAMCGNGGPLVGPARVGKDGAQPAESTKPSSGDAKGGKDEKKATPKERELDKAATAGGDKLNGGRKADFWWWVKPKGRKRSNTVSETTEVAAASPPQTDDGTNDGDKATIDNINHTHDAAPAVSAHRDTVSSIDAAASMSPAHTDLESSDLTSHGSRDGHHGHSESAGEGAPSPPPQEEHAREGVAAAGGGRGVELDSLESYVQDVERSRSPVKEEKQQQHGEAHDDVDDHHHGDHGEEQQHSSLPRTDPGEESHKACDHPHEHQWDEMHAASDDEAHKHKAGAGAHDENREEKQEGDGHGHAESRMERTVAEHGQQATQEKEGEEEEEKAESQHHDQDKGGDHVEPQQPQQNGKHHQLKSSPKTEASSADDEQAQQQPHHMSVQQATTAQPIDTSVAEREHQDAHGEEEKQKEHKTSQHGSPHQAPASPPEPRLSQASSSPEDQAKVSPPPSPHQQEEKEDTDRHALPQQQQSPSHHNHHQQQHIVRSPHDRDHRHDQQQHEEDKADEEDEEEQGKEQEGEERKVEDDSRTRRSNRLSADKHTDKPEEISLRNSTHDHEPLQLKDRVLDATAKDRTDKIKPTAHTDSHKRHEQGVEEEKKQKQRSAALKPKSRPHELWGVCGRFIIMSFIIVVLFGGVLGVMIARRPINGSLAIGQKLRVGDRLTYRCDKSVWRVSPSCVNLDLLVTNEGVLRLIENAGTSKEKLKWQSPRRKKPTVSTKYTASLDEKSRLVVELEGRAVFKTSPLIQNKYPEDDFPFISQPPGLHLDGVWGGFYVVPCPVASKPVEVTNPMSIG